MITGKKVVQISGKMGAGKSATATQLADLIRHLNQRVLVHELIYAGVIYTMHNFCLNQLRSRGVIDSDTIKDGNLLQVLGTEWGRKHLGEDVWTSCLTTDVNNLFNTNQHIPAVAIVSDCRFKNEFDNFPDALQVRLECPESIRKRRCASWRDKSDHISETDLDEYVEQGKFDLVIDTSKFTLVEVSTQILDALTQGNWKTKRTSSPKPAAKKKTAKKKANKRTRK